jgi:hypothetical protein
MIDNCKKKWNIAIWEAVGKFATILGVIYLGIQIFDYFQDDYQISATIKRSFFILPAFYQEETDKVLDYINNKNTDGNIINKKFITDFFTDFYDYLGKLCGITYIWEIEIVNEGYKEIADLELSLPLIKGFYEIWGKTEGEDKGYKKIENGAIKLKSIKPKRTERIALWTYPSDDPHRDYYFQEETTLSHSNGSVDITYIGKKQSFESINLIKDNVSSCSKR